MLAADKGEHFTKYTSCIGKKVKECVFQPLDDNPPMDLDGERLPTKPTYVKIIPHLFQTFV